MSGIQIPFNRLCVSGREYEYIRQAVDSGHVSGDGPFTRKCQGLLERILGGSRALLTTSCTDALEMAALLLDVRPGDEVILPSFTFVSTGNAFALRGARCVFADVRRDTLNLDESQLEDLTTPRTKAIVAVHYAGVGCEMSAIGEIAERHGIRLVEDNAQGLFGEYRGRPLGTFGALAALSFHETKNVSCGEGGALVINDPAFLGRAEILREKGTDRSRFFRGEVDKYTWIDLGSSFLPSDILAAFLYAQLEARDSIQAARRRIWNSYAAQLDDWARRNDARLPLVPPHCEQPYHMFYLLLPDHAARQALIDRLRNRGILAVFHYQPLHRSRMGLSMGGASAHCPVADDVSERLLRLPFYTDLTASDQARVIETVREFRV
jgi:dTDP-4-amino-4,6-dideoxygalactose transaminase